MKSPCFRNTRLPLVFLSLLFLAVSCKKSSDTTTDAVTAPTIVTSGLIINLTSTTAQSGGTITATGGAAITAMGVCYSTTNKTPGLNDSKTSETVNASGVIPFSFTSDISSLTANTTYYVRAYASNSIGTSYGSVVQFTTSASLSDIVTAVTTFAGNGTAGIQNGALSSATFNNPQGLAIDAAGNIFVADSYNSMIREITAGGMVNTFAGNGTIGYAEGDAATAAEFYGPSGITVDGQGNVFVADFGNNVIRKIAAGVVSTYSGSGEPGFANGTGNTLVKYSNPQGVAIDASGNLYIADHGNNVIRKVTAAGVVSTFAGTKTAGYVNATGTLASFNNPTDVAVDAAGNVYVADKGNSAIRKITPAGVVTTIAGGPTQSDLLNSPTALTLDKAGNIYITDEGGRVIECTTSNVLYILAGTLNVSGFTNGTGTTALFNSPEGIAVDGAGNIYVADQGNNCIRKLVVTKNP